MILLLPLATWKVEPQMHHPIRTFNLILLQCALLSDLKLVPLTGGEATGQLEYVFPVTVLESPAHVHIFGQLCSVVVTYRSVAAHRPLDVVLDAAHGVHRLGV